MTAIFDVAFAGIVAILVMIIVTIGPELIRDTLSRRTARSKPTVVEIKDNITFMRYGTNRILGKLGWFIDAVIDFHPLIKYHDEQTSKDLFVEPSVIYGQDILQAYWLRSLDKLLLKPQQIPTLSSTPLPSTSSSSDLNVCKTEVVSQLMLKPCNPDRSFYRGIEVDTQIPHSVMITSGKVTDAYKMNETKWYSVPSIVQNATLICKSLCGNVRIMAFITVPDIDEFHHITNRLLMIYASGKYECTKPTIVFRSKGLSIADIINGIGAKLYPECVMVSLTQLTFLTVVTPLSNEMDLCMEVLKLAPRTVAMTTPIVNLDSYSATTATSTPSATITTSTPSSLTSTRSPPSSDNNNENKKTA